ncbi:DUF4136 domain-containing protein [Tsuneonella sp. HG222]
MTFFPFTARGLKIAAASLALAGVSACTTGFNANVSRFQTQLPAPSGQTFFVVAEDPALAGGLEFSQYAGEVAQNLSELGYVQASSPDTATMLVRFDYGVDNGRERVRSTGISRGFGYDPFFSPWYSYSRPVAYRDRQGNTRLAYIPTRPWGYGFHDPFFDRGGYESYTVYTSGIDMKIDNQATGQRLFEGKAQALSTSNRLQYVVPNLVEAMFTGFPGNSGETVRISVAPENMPAQRNVRR